MKTKTLNHLETVIAIAQFVFVIKLSKTQNFARSKLLHFVPLPVLNKFCYYVEKTRFKLLSFNFEESQNFVHLYTM